MGTRASVVVAHGLSNCGSRALEHWLNSCGARTSLLCSMWDLPRSGIEPVSPALTEGFFITEPSGKPLKSLSKTGQEYIGFSVLAKKLSSKPLNGWYQLLSPSAHSLSINTTHSLLSLSKFQSQRKRSGSRTEKPFLGPRHVSSLSTGQSFSLVPLQDYLCLSEVRLSPVFIKKLWAGRHQ